MPDFVLLCRTEHRCPKHGCCQYLRLERLEERHETPQVCIVTVACCLASSLTFASDGLKDLFNYYPLPEGLGSSGQPSPTQFAAIRAAGFDVVLNLAMPTSENALAEEGRLVSETGMTYVHIPVPWDAPNSEHLKKFFAVLDAMRRLDQRVWCTAPRIIARPPSPIST